MTDKIFVDTNVLVYAHDLDAGEKYKTAAFLIENLWEERNGVISTLVLQEFYVTVTQKISSVFTPANARGIIENYMMWNVEILTSASVLTASIIAEKNQLSFWDAMIVTAARNSGSKKILTEDMNNGQIIDDVLIENPFK